MAKKQLSQEDVSKIQEQIRQRRSERQASVSGTTKAASANYVYATPTSWTAFTLNGQFWVQANVAGNGSNIGLCSIISEPLNGGPAYAESMASGNLGSSVYVAAGTTLELPAAGSVVTSQITGSTTGGDQFSYTANLYVYNLQWDQEAA